MPREPNSYPLSSPFPQHEPDQELVHITLIHHLRPHSSPFPASKTIPTISSASLPRARIMLHANSLGRRTTHFALVRLLLVVSHFADLPSTCLDEWVSLCILDLFFVPYICLDHQVRRPARERYFPRVVGALINTNSTLLYPVTCDARENRPVLI